jgi:NADH-quinone oxidoreductase subunit L
VPGVDPAAALGPARALLADGFRLDAVQNRLFVRPVRALAGYAKSADERVVDAAVEGTGTTTSEFGALLTAAHRFALPGAIAAVFAGALLLAVWYGAAS